MGRSFYRMTPDRVVENFKAKPFYHQLSSSYFTMILRDGKYFQRRWQTGPDGKETNVDEKQVDFVVGSGNHARTYLHLTNRNTLQVLPLSWYSENGGYWAMSPGYDHPDFPGSVRPVHYECMYCHNAYPKVPGGDAAEVVYTPPIPEGIDCQRCHGPGQRHVDLASAGAPAEQLRAAIVNPKRLSPEREFEVCLQCHLETTSRGLPHALRRPNREPFSYVPGEPLADFRVEFDAASKNQDFEIAHAAYRLMSSQCFLKSEGKLRCTTCHNPHDIPHGAVAEKRYDSICMNCHQNVASRTDLSAVHKSGEGCVGCHMPKRRTDDVVHVVMTDHFIQRLKPAENLVAAKAEKPESAATAYRGEVVPYYPRDLSSSRENAILAGVAQVRDRSNLMEGLPRLAAIFEKQHPSGAGDYADLAQGYRFSGDSEQAVHYYDLAAKMEPSAARLIQLGNALMEGRRLGEAESALRRATTLSPSEAVGWGTLGWVLWQEDKAMEARSSLAKAIELDPELPELHNNLANVLWGTGDQQGAITEFRKALRIQPGVADWRANLGRVLASSNQLSEAEWQAAEAVKLDPNSAPAHELLGSLQAGRGSLEKGIGELQAAVRLQPDFWRAHYELGIALGGKGDSARAMEQLRIAAGGQDPQASAAAKQVLDQLIRR